MIQDWQLEEKDEHISQAVLLPSKLLITPYDCELRDVCEKWIEGHKSYLSDSYSPPEAKGYDISEIDIDNLGF